MKARIRHKSLSRNYPNPYPNRYYNEPRPYDYSYGYQEDYRYYEHRSYAYQDDYYQPRAYEYQNDQYQPRSFAYHDDHTSLEQEHDNVASPNSQQESITTEVECLKSICVELTKNMKELRTDIQKRAIETREVFNQERQSVVKNVDIPLESPNELPIETPQMKIVHPTTNPLPSVKLSILTHHRKNPTEQKNPQRQEHLSRRERKKWIRPSKDKKKLTRPLESLTNHFVRNYMPDPMSHIPSLINLDLMHIILIYLNT